MTFENLLPMIKDIATIFAAIISAFSLFIFTQKDKQSYLRINVNSKKTEFKIVLENVGSNLAKIEKIKLKKVNVEADSDELSLSKFGNEDYIYSSCPLNKVNYYVTPSAPPVYLHLM